MRILLVDPTLVYPGEGAKLTAFKAIPGVTLEALSGERHRDEARQAQMPRMAQWHGIPLHLGKIIGKFPNRTWMLGGLRDCLKKQPDVILAYSDWNHWLTLQIAIAKTLISPRSKLIFQAWENQPPTWRRHPQPNSALYVLDSVVEKVVFRLADGAAARNAEAQRVLVRRGFRKPIRLIPWGVDMGFFHPREPEHTEEFTVGYVGRLVREKGVADLLMALQGLEGVKALIIGGGPEAKKLRELADQRDINAEFVAAVPQETLPEWYSRMDLLVLPSRTTRKWAEQFGRVLVEAMAMGVPVIGSDSGAIPWVIGDRDLIFPEGDSPSLRNLILKLKSDEILRNMKAKIGQMRAREFFTWEIHARATVEFCREIYS